MTTLEGLHACALDGCAAAAGNRFGDPLFTTATAVRIGLGSPAIDAGLDPSPLGVGIGAENPLLDLHLETRPVDGPDPEGDGSSDDTAEWDIGAHELVPPVP